MSSFLDPLTGQVRLVRLNADGSVPVAEVDEGPGSSVPHLLAQLVWEVQELRRVTCEASGQFFNEYPPEAGGGE